MTPPRYQTSKAFKQALEARIRQASVASGRDMGRFRQILIYDRFLVRLTRVLGPRVLAKGGVVLELRLGRARTTKDVDLMMSGNPDLVLEELEEALRTDTGDFLEFRIVPDPDHPEILAEGMTYSGRRFRAQAFCVGKPYGFAFGVDVALGETHPSEADHIPSSGFLEFAGIEPQTLRLYPKTVHIAEKLHAYTMPRTRPNSRVKDLPDIALLAMTGPIGAAEVRRAIDHTFQGRATHLAPPGSVPLPPPDWAVPYERMAREDRLPWPTLPEVHSVVEAFLGPVLRGGEGIWNVESWAWEGPRRGAGDLIPD